MKRILLALIASSTFFAGMAQVTQADAKQAMSLVSASKAAIGLSNKDFSEVIVTTAYFDQSTGLNMVYLQQTYAGIPVLKQILPLAFKNGQLVSKAGNFDHSFQQIASIRSGIPAISAESAVQAAVADRKLGIVQLPVSVASKDNGRVKEYGNLGVSKENIVATLTWVPVEKVIEKGRQKYAAISSLRLAWQVYIIPIKSSDYWLVCIDALDNHTIRVDNLTVYDNFGHPGDAISTEYAPTLIKTSSVSNRVPLLSAINQPAQRPFDINGPLTLSSASYLVVPYPAISPEGVGGAPAIVTNPWLAAPGNATTLQWNSSATENYGYTRGNNVWAYQDGGNANAPALDRSATATYNDGASLIFNYPPDFAADPTQTAPSPNQQFNITNLFYWNNIVHDIMYQYGFDEPAHNFQDDNLGRGGIGNDHVNAEAQDGSGTNNANFSTPNDGSPGKMQMYLWNLNGANPRRDGDVDNNIIVHEYGHGISTRLTGGGATVCLSGAEQMGEGWSDFYGLMLTTDWSTATPTDGYNIPRGIGVYALNNANNPSFPGAPPGIRHYQYSTNMAVNPLVYATTIPSLPHDRGEIWAAALWDMTWNLIAQDGISANLYDATGTGGNIVAMRLVTLGLKLQPCSIGFIDGRNAILAADQTLYGGVHHCAIMNAFARRGMGVNASQGSANSVTDQVPDFTNIDAVVVLTQTTNTTVPEQHNIVYNNRVTNTGCDGISNYVLRDTLPATVTFVAATNGGSYNATSRVVSWPVNIAFGDAADYGFTVTINAGTYFPPTPSSVAKVDMQSRLFNTVDAIVKVSGITTTLISPSGVTINIAQPLTVVAENGQPANNAPDPGEVVTVNVPLFNIGATSSTNLVATLQATGGVVNPGNPQVYGAVALYDTVSRAYTFTVNGNCGDSLTLTFALQDGTTDLGTVSYKMLIGKEIINNQTFANTAQIVVTDNSTAVTYPSVINVSGLQGTLKKITIGLKQINHTWVGDLDLLLVSPTGQKMIILSDAGAIRSNSTIDLLLSDDATSVLPVSQTIATGTYRPANYGTATDVFPSPAPVGPYASPASVGTATLNGTFGGQNPNGAWSLYVVDDESADLGNINGGWEISITSSAVQCSTPPSPPSIYWSAEGQPGISACFGSPSSNVRTYSLGGSDLVADLIATAPAGFEVSLNPTSGYATSIAIPAVGGNVSAALYVHSAATAPVGSISGNVTLSTTGASSITIYVESNVKPLPVATVDPVTQQVCSSTSIQDINISSDVNGTTFSWTRDNAQLVTGLPEDGTGTTISGTAVNTATSASTVTYTITPAADGCTGEPVQAIVEVKALPTATLTGGETVCSFDGLSTTLTVTLTGEAPWYFTYSDGNNSVEVATNDAVNVLNVTTTLPVTYTIASLESNGCSAIPQDLFGYAEVLQQTYTISAIQGSNGSISPAGDTTVNCGDSRTYYITPDSGYSIADVIVDGSSVGAVSSYSFSNVTANHTVSVSFAQNTFSIFAVTGDNGTIDPLGNISIPIGNNKTYTITPNPCYQVADVLVDGQAVGAVSTYTFENVTADHTISVSFSHLNYSITASAGANGSISPPGITNVNCSGSQTYTITPNPCYQVANVLVDGQSVGAVGTYTFSDVSANHNISASFSPGVYTITASSDINGSISPAGVTSINCNGSQRYDFFPNSCYEISNVVIDGQSIGAEGVYTFTNVTVSHTISVSYIKTQQSLTAQLPSNGTISPSGSIVVDCGSNKTYTITPTSCYQVADVLVDGQSVGAVSNYTFTNVTNFHTISATFSQLNYAITASAGANGTISPAGITSVGCGGNQLYQINANPGYTVQSVIVDGISQGAIVAYSFSNISSTHTISATFIALPPTTCTPPTLSAVVSDVLCKGGSTGSIVLTPAGGTGPFTYAWIGPYSYNATSRDAIGIPAGKYRVTVTAAGGCTVSSIIYTVGQPASSLSMTTTVNGAITCNGGTTSVTLTGTGGTLPYSGAGTFANQLAGAHTYTITDANSCSVSRTITIAQPAAITVTATPGVIACATGTTSVTVTAANGLSPYTGTGVFTNQSAGLHTYTVTDARSCSSSTTINIPGGAGAGSAPAAPTSVTGGIYGLCGGGTFTYNVAPVTNATGYTWTVPASFTILNGQGTSQLQVSVPFNFTGVATMQVRAFSDCGTSANYRFTVFAVIYYPGSINGPTVAAPLTADVHYSYPAVPGYVYNWLVPAGATITAGQGTSNITVRFGTRSGNVSVSVTNACGTSSYDNKAVMVAAAKNANPITSTVTKPSAFTVYPNPVQKNATVVFNAQKKGERYEIRVLNTLGAVLYKTHGTANPGENMVKLDMGKYTNGMYLINLVTEENTQTLKLYKQQ